jgi:hypothetical protein
MINVDSSNTTLTTSGLGAGQLVIATIANPRENPGSEGKNRPALICAVHGDWIVVEGFTTQSCRRGGEAREPVPDWEELGFTKPSFLWGRCVAIPAINVVQSLGWSTPELATKVIEIGNLSDAEATSLLIASYAHGKREAHGQK